MAMSYELIVHKGSMMSCGLEWRRRWTGKPITFVEAVHYPEQPKRGTAATQVKLDELIWKLEGPEKSSWIWRSWTRAGSKRYEGVLRAGIEGAWQPSA